MEDNPELDAKYRLYAQKRLTARAWRFARRFKKSSIFSKWFFLYLKGIFHVNNEIVKNCREANKVYEDFLD